MTDNTHNKGSPVMRRTLSDIRSVDTNAALRKLRDEQKLSLREIAQYTLVSYDTVVGWMTHDPKSKRFRRMPNNALELLKTKLMIRDNGN